MVRRCLVLLFSILPLMLQAQQWAPAQETSPRYLADIEIHTAQELHRLLLRAEQLFDSGKLKPGSDAPVAFILHGAEGRALLSSNGFGGKVECV